MSRNQIMQRSNFESNKSFWENYAKHWHKNNLKVENISISEQEKESYIQYLGDEWGKVEDVVEIVEEFIKPFINQRSIVAELGVGGGRVASKVVEKVQELYCFDIAEEMLRKAGEHLNCHPQAKLVLLDKPHFEAGFYNKFDFVYSFDVLVHFDLISIWQFLKEIYRILKPSGKVFIHTLDITTPMGWERFKAQRNYGEGLYFPTSPESIRFLLSKVDMEVVKESQPNQNNFYTYRDYLVVAQKQDE